MYHSIKLGSQRDDANVKNTSTARPIFLTFISTKYQFIRLFPVVERSNQIRIEIMLLLQRLMQIERHRYALSNASRSTVPAAIAGRVTADRAGRRGRR